MRTKKNTSAKTEKKAARPQVPVSRGYVIRIADVQQVPAYLTRNRTSVHDVKMWSHENSSYLIRRTDKKKRVYENRLMEGGNSIITLDGGQTDLWLHDHGLVYDDLFTFAQWNTINRD